MLVFAHLGLTLAAARQIACANLAFVMLGSMLPDIIDKPLGEVLFGTPAMGRTFAHILLFLMFLGTAAYYLRDLRLAWLACGVWAHLLLDFMWQSPSTLLEKQAEDPSPFPMNNKTYEVDRSCFSFASYVPLS